MGVAVSVSVSGVVAVSWAGEGGATRRRAAPTARATKNQNVLEISAGAGRCTLSIIAPMADSLVVSMTYFP